MRYRSLATMLALLVLSPAWLADAHAENLDRETESAFTTNLQSFIVANPDGPKEDLQLILVTAHVAHRDVICDQPISEPDFGINLMIVMACSAVESPDSYNASILASPALVRAADLAAKRIREDENPDLGDDKNTLQTRAQAEFHRALDETGVTGDLFAAWERHVEQRSSCYEEFVGPWRTSAIQRQQQLRESGYCDSWERHLNICSVEEQSLLHHIRFFRSASLGADKRQTLEALFVTNGIGHCMTAILEQRDPQLAERISKLGSEIPGDNETKRALGDQAWTIWREHGIERWLDATFAAAGTVPEGILTELEACNAGQIPEPAP